MNESMIFQQMRFIRNRTLAALDATTEEMADKVPEGFANNIRWNLGHIYVTQEKLAYSFLQEDPYLPEGYLHFFNAKTSPSTWESTPPSLAELRNLLATQLDRLEETFRGRLAEKGEKPFRLGEHVQFDTLAEVLSFMNWHEGLHQGTISSLKRAQGIENLFTLPSKNA